MAAHPPYATDCPPRGQRRGLPRLRRRRPPRQAPEWGLIADSGGTARKTARCVFPGLAAAPDGQDGSVIFRRAAPGRPPGPAVLDYRAGRAVIHYARRIEETAAMILGSLASSLIDSAASDPDTLPDDLLVSVERFPHDDLPDGLHPAGFLPVREEAGRNVMILAVCAGVMHPALPAEIGQLLTAHLDACAGSRRAQALT